MFHGPKQLIKVKCLYYPIKKILQKLGRYFDFRKCFSKIFQQLIIHFKFPSFQALNNHGWTLSQFEIQRNFFFDFFFRLKQNKYKILNILLTFVFCSKNNYFFCFFRRNKKQLFVLLNLWQYHKTIFHIFTFNISNDKQTNKQNNLLVVL